MIKYVLFYLAAVNLAAAVICLVDKYKALKGYWRISENALFGISAIGGAVGMYAMMRLIRHKTRHKRFMIGLPIIIALQIVAFCLALRFF